MLYSEQRPSNCRPTEVQYWWKTGWARVPVNIDFRFECRVKMTETSHNGAVLVQMAWKRKASNREIGWAGRSVVWNCRMLRRLECLEPWQKIHFIGKCKEAPGVVVIDPSVTKTRMYLLIVILNKLPFSFMKCIYFPFLCFLFILPVFGLLCVLCYGTVSVSFSFLNAMHGRHSAQ